jgi:hypothetical protein
MKITALRDNLSKVKVVEKMNQQMLRLPGEMQELVAEQIKKRRRAKKKKIIRSKESDTGKLNSKKDSSPIGENAVKGRKEDLSEDAVEVGRQCCIDLKA